MTVTNQNIVNIATTREKINKLYKVVMSLRCTRLYTSDHKVGLCKRGYWVRFPRVLIYIHGAYH